MNQIRKLSRKQVIGIAISLFPVAWCLAVILDPTDYRFIPSRNNEFSTVVAFAYSLAYNQLDSVKTYVSEEEWAFIDEWGQTHEPISEECYQEDIDDAPQGIGGGNPPTWFVQVLLQCPDGNYRMKIDVELGLTPHGWEINKIISLCERDDCYK